MVIVGDVRTSNAFITIINKKSAANKERFDVVVKECRLAMAVGKPMYAIVQKGVNLGVLADMPWKKMVRFNTNSDVSGILNFIDNDIRIGGFYT